MKLISVYKSLETSIPLLYALLLERDASINISHKEMPTLEKHTRFVESKPYKVWRLIEVNEQIVGACYFTKADEIGVFIFKKFRGEGYGTKAVQLLLDTHPEISRVLANINPQNERSLKMFQKLGFKIVQYTLVREFTCEHIGCSSPATQLVETQNDGKVRLCEHHAKISLKGGE